MSTLTSEERAQIRRSGVRMPSANAVLDALEAVEAERDALRDVIDASVPDMNRVIADRDALRARLARVSASVEKMELAADVNVYHWAKQLRAELADTP